MNVAAWKQSIHYGMSSALFIDNNISPFVHALEIVFNANLSELFMKPLQSISFYWIETCATMTDYVTWLKTTNCYTHSVHCHSFISTNHTINIWKK